MLRHRLFYLLLATLLALTLVLAHRHQLTWDWSSDKRNQLHAQSLQILSTLQGPIEIQVFMPEYPVQRAAIGELLEKFRRAHPAITYRFIDPARHPEQVRALGIARTPLLLLRYCGRERRLEQITEQSLSNALARLSMADTGWLGVISGHGEARLHGRANFDLGDFGRLLERKGYRVVDLELTATGQIPRNLALLLLAAPATALSPNETDLLVEYLEGGGNLLWLADGHIPAPLAKSLEIRFLPGVVVDAAAADLGIESPTVAVARPASDHRLVRTLKAPVLMPTARALEHRGTAWEATPLLHTSPRSWNETGSLKGIVERNPEQGEERGPLTLALLLSRGTQQVVITGDADFLSNSYVGNGANQAFGLALVHWLGRNEHLVEIPPSRAADQQLHWQASTSAAVAGLFLVALPALLAMAGILIPWWRRRR
jgi:hypothetical protein